MTRPSPFYPLVEAHAHPVPDTAAADRHRRRDAAGARLAARIGDGWSTFDDNFEANLPLYLEALEANGRRREDQHVYVGFQGDWLSDETLAGLALGRPRRARAGIAGARRAPTAPSSSPGRPPTSTRSWRRPDAGRPRACGRGPPFVAPSAGDVADNDPSTRRRPGVRPASGPKPLTHGCLRCGAPVPLDVGLCERCNPLGLKDSSASQVHGTVFIAVLVAVIGLALLGRLTLAGVGPFAARVGRRGRRRGRSGDHAHGHEPGDGRRPDDVPRRPTPRTGAAAARRSCSARASSRARPLTFTKTVNELGNDGRAS